MVEDVLARVGHLTLQGQSDPAAARTGLLDLWQEIGGQAGDAMHRCAVAHALADVSDAVAEELRWDLTALKAADAVSEARLTATGASVSVAALYPSLHLNLADCYRRLGDVEQASAHVTRGLAAVAALPDDGYGRMIRGALDRLAGRLRAGQETARG